jgi:hypothetical protein
MRSTKRAASLALRSRRMIADSHLSRWPSIRVATPFAMRLQPIICRRQTGRWRSTRPSLLQGPLQGGKIGPPAAGGPARTLSSPPHLGAWRACCVHIQIMERRERVKTGTAFAKSAGDSALHLPYCPPLNILPSTSQVALYLLPGRPAHCDNLKSCVRC